MKMLKFKYLIILFCIGLCSMSSLQAQRLELRFNKEFSNDKMINKTLGAGGSFIIDGWVDHLDFQINFDYAGHKEDADYTGVSTKIAKYKGGVAALYTRPIGRLLHLRVGGDLSYNYINKINTLWDNGNHYNTAHRAHALGIGAIAQLQIQLGQIFRIGAGLIPTYLIPLVTDVSQPNVECDFKKGMFVMQLQIGLEIRLVKE
jgi:hypothetical protein